MVLPGRQPAQEGHPYAKEQRVQLDDFDGEVAPIKKRAWQATTTVCTYKINVAGQHRAVPSVVSAVNTDELVSPVVFESYTLPPAVPASGSGAMQPGGHSLQQIRMVGGEGSCKWVLSDQGGGEGNRSTLLAICGWKVDLGGSNT